MSRPCLEALPEVELGALARGHLGERRLLGLARAHLRGPERRRARALAMHLDERARGAQVVVHKAAKPLLVEVDDVARQHLRKETVSVWILEGKTLAHVLHSFFPKKYNGMENVPFEGGEIEKEERRTGKKGMRKRVKESATGLCSLARNCQPGAKARYLETGSWQQFCCALGKRSRQTSVLYTLY